jgi:hypothetical protein
MDAKGNSTQATPPAVVPLPAVTPVATPDKMLTFTQDQMNALMSREKHEGKDSVYRAFGVDPKDKTAIEQARAKLTQQRQQSTPQPVSDKQEQAQAPEKAESAPPAQAPQINAVVRAEAKIALLGAGVQPELLDDALTLVLSKVEKSEQVQTEIDALKAKHGTLFAQAKQTTGQLVGGLGTSVQGAPKTASEFGKQLAQARNAGRTQQQFFGGGNKQ